MLNLNFFRPHSSNAMRQVFLISCVDITDCSVVRCNMTECLSPYKKQCKNSPLPDGNQCWFAFKIYQSTSCMCAQRIFLWWSQWYFVSSVLTRPLGKHFSPCQKLIFSKKTFYMLSLTANEHPYHHTPPWWSLAGSNEDNRSQWHHPSVPGSWV